MSTGSSCANGKDNRLALQYTRKERFLKITFCEQVRKEGMEVRKKDRTYSNLKKVTKINGNRLILDVYVQGAS